MYTVVWCGVCVACATGATYFLAIYGPLVCSDACVRCTIELQPVLPAPGRVPEALQHCSDLLFRWLERGREGGREGEREGGREGEREAGREGAKSFLQRVL